MKRKLLGLTILVASAKCFAICSTLATADDRSIQGDVWTGRSGHMEYNILNQTSVTQSYKICYQLVTQTLQHTNVFHNSWCEDISIPSGQSSGSVKRDPLLNIKYDKYSQGFYHIGIDAIVEVSGECHSLAHDMKRIKVY